MSEGKLEAIWIKRAKLGPMDPKDSATLIEDLGILGNADQGGKRQVTIIEREVFERFRTTLPGAEPSMRRANFMVSGVRLANTRGHVLAVGGVRILVHGETRPCYRMDAQCEGLTAALHPDWRGGVFGVVVKSGEVRVGDAVSLEPPTATAS